MRKVSRDSRPKVKKGELKAMETQESTTHTTDEIDDYRLELIAQAIVNYNICRDCDKSQIKELIKSGLRSQKIASQTSETEGINEIEFGDGVYHICIGNEIAYILQKPIVEDRTANDQPMYKRGENFEMLGIVYATPNALNDVLEEKYGKLSTTRKALNKFLGWNGSISPHSPNYELCDRFVFMRDFDKMRAFVRYYISHIVNEQDAIIDYDTIRELINQLIYYTDIFYNTKRIKVFLYNSGLLPEVKITTKKDGTICNEENEEIIYDPKATVVQQIIPGPITFNHLDDKRRRCEDTMIEYIINTMFTREELDELINKRRFSNLALARRTTERRKNSNG